MRNSARIDGDGHGNPAKQAGSPEKIFKKGLQSQPVFNPLEWISQAEAARIREVSRQAIRKLVLKGRLQTLEIGGRIFVSRKDVITYQPEPGGRPKSK